MMKLIAINGSPRKLGNTSEVLMSAIDKAQEQGADTELIHLYNYSYTGCRSCFACKKIGSQSFGHCVLKDDATPILEKILLADVVIFGMPIYFGDMTAGMRALLERLWFPSLNYDQERTVNYPRDVVCGLVYTMNASMEFYTKLYEQKVKEHAEKMELLVGPTEVFVVEDTLQFEDYTKYSSSMFDADHKQKQHELVFPQQKKQAAEWTKSLLAKARALKAKNN